MASKKLRALDKRVVNTQLLEEINEIVDAIPLQERSQLMAKSEYMHSASEGVKAALNKSRIEALITYLYHIPICSDKATKEITKRSAYQIKTLLFLIDQELRYIK